MTNTCKNCFYLCNFAFFPYLDDHSDTPQMTDYKPLQISTKR